MRSYYYLSAFASLASRTNYASAFVIPTAKTCPGVACRPVATFIGMTDDAKNKDNPAALEESAIKLTLESDTEEEIEAPEETEEVTLEEEVVIGAAFETEAPEEAEEVTLEEEAVVEAALESSNDEETEAPEEAEEVSLEEEVVVEATVESSNDEETEAPEEAEEVTLEEEAVVEAAVESSNDEGTEAPEEAEEVTLEEEVVVEAAVESSIDEETEAPEEAEEVTLEEEAAVEPVLKSSTDGKTEALKTDKVEEKKDIPWMELLGAAAELAGALGDVAVKAASAALDDMTPKEVIDVSIPYDAASAQAYSEWLTKFNKEDPGLERYDYFKKNYRTVTVSNVIAKKQIRDGIPEGETPPEILKLNQYADLSTEEYLEIQKSLEPKSWGDLFGELASVALDMASGSASSETETEATPASKKKAPASKKKTTASKPKPAAKKTPSTDSGISFFGFGTKSVKKPPQAKKQQPRRALQKAAPAKKITLTKKKAPPKVSGIPVLSRWKQNKDGSLTGFISNSPSYRTGTKITTSPVPRGAKGGSVVRTGSGSRYKLK